MKDHNIWILYRLIRSSIIKFWIKWIMWLCDSHKFLQTCLSAVGKPICANDCIQPLSSTPAPERCALWQCARLDNHQLFYQSSRAHNQNNKLALIIKSSLYSNNINTRESARKRERKRVRQQRIEKKSAAARAKSTRNRIERKRERTLKERE